MDINSDVTSVLYILKNFDSLCISGTVQQLHALGTYCVGQMAALTAQCGLPEYEYVK